MKKYDVLYTWPLSQIDHLCSSNQADAFAEAFEADRDIDAFTGLTEQIRMLGADLREAHQERSLFLRWNELRTCIGDFERMYSAFPGAELRKLHVALILSEKLASSLAEADSSDSLLDAELDEAAFEIRRLEAGLPVRWFVQQNTRSILDSILVMDCSDLSQLAVALERVAVSPDILLFSLAALYRAPSLPAGHVAMVRRKDEPITDEAVGAFARLAILASGLPIHSPVEYSATLRVLDRHAFVAGENYQQLSDVLDVLSEYNSRKETLAKYLTLYHVIENFMFRAPIVQLERQHNGRMFTIRDFKQLYRQVEVNELEALERFFTAVFKVAAQPGTLFTKHIEAAWIALASGSKSQLNEALSLLPRRRDGRAIDADEFTRNDFVGNFARTVYAVRNAIVHNKETEFHLTYATLDVAIATLVEQFLIPTLEEICFALIATPNTLVWYANRELLLFK